MVFDHAPFDSLKPLGGQLCSSFKHLNNAGSKEHMKSSVISAFSVFAVILFARAAATAATSSENTDSLTGKWRGSFAPTSRMGVLQAKVNLTPEKMAQAVSITGIWKGSFDKVGPSGRVTPAPFSLNIRKDGARLTGMAGPSPQEQVPISNGRVEGDKIMLEAPHPPVGPNMKFDLSLTNGHLQGTARMEERPEKVPSRPLRAVLVQSGDEISGQVGFQADQRFAIKHGRREKDKILLETDEDGLLVNYVLHVMSGRLEGEAKMEHDGHLITAKVTLEPES